MVPPWDLLQQGSARTAIVSYRCLRSGSVRRGNEPGNRTQDAVNVSRSYVLSGERTTKTRFVNSNENGTLNNQLTRNDISDGKRTTVLRQRNLMPWSWLKKVVALDVGKPDSCAWTTIMNLVAYVGCCVHNAIRRSVWFKTTSTHWKDSLLTSKLVRELHRRRILAGDKASIKETEAEVSVFLRYNKEPTINDLQFQGKSLYFASTDDEDLTFMVVRSKDGKAWRVHDSLEYNTYIFVQADPSNDYDIVGWLPNEELHEAPHVERWFVVDRDHFFPMPETYSFQPSCPRMPCNESAIWDWSTDSWDCFGRCGKHRYDTHAASYIAKQSDQVGEGETAA